MREIETIKNTCQGNKMAGIYYISDRIAKKTGVTQRPAKDKSLCHFWQGEPREGQNYQISG
jgi:hypothetical protein